MKPSLGFAPKVCKLAGFCINFTRTHRGPRPPELARVPNATEVSVGKMLR